MFYEDIDLITSKLHNPLSAAESHGMATGMLCVNIHTRPGFWLNEISQDSDDMNHENITLLEQLFEETRTVLENDEFAFTLLLPDEDMPLNTRLEAFRTWCQGFLYGMGSIPYSSELTEESRGAMKDIAEFTRLDTHAEGEEAENEFMELSEFLRAAVLFMRTELASGQGGRVH
jgi:yecA family protein